MKARPEPPNLSRQKCKREALYFKFATFGPGKLIQLREKNLWYCEIFGDGGIISKELIHPTPTQWRAFWQGMERARVWEWKRRYKNAEVLDGDWWELRLKNGNKTVRSTGFNSYPDREGSTYSPQSPFGIVVKSLRRLCGGRALD